MAERLTFQQKVLLAEVAHAGNAGYQPTRREDYSLRVLRRRGLVCTRPDAPGSMSCPAFYVMAAAGWDALGVPRPATKLEVVR